MDTILTKTCVTAVLFAEQLGSGKNKLGFIAFSSGSFFHLINLESHEIIIRVKCFDGGIKIHGIVQILHNLDILSFCVYGSGSICIMEIDLINNKSKIFHPFPHINDWILKIKSLSFCSHCLDLYGKKRSQSSYSLNLAVSLTYSLQVWNLNVDFGPEPNELNSANRMIGVGATLIYTKTPSSRCLAKSSSIWGSCACFLLIASGTMFDHFFVWSVVNGPLEKEKDIPGVDTSSIVVKKNSVATGRQKGTIFDIDWSKDSKRICTVSDDRSVRVWKLSKGHLKNTCKEYGHRSRVFNAKWSNCNSKIISTGEEGSAILWIFKRNKDHLAPMAFYDCHKSQIWSLDYTNEMFVTGGEDGSVKLWDCSKSLRAEHKICQKNENDVVNCIRILSPDCFLVGTGKGKVIEVKEGIKKILYTSDKGITNLSVLDSHLLFVGTLSGKIFIFKNNETIKTKEKVSALNALNEKKGIEKIFPFCHPEIKNILLYPVYVCLLAFQPKEKSVSFWGLGSDLELLLSRTVDLNFIKSSAKVVSVLAFCHDNKLVLAVGDSTSCLHFFYYAKEDFTHVQTIKRLHHGENYINHLEFVNKKLYSCGRDSTIKQLVIDTKTKSPTPDSEIVVSQSRSFNCSPITFVEKLFFRDFESSSLFAAGFHHTHFYLFDLSREYVVFKTDSKGGYRPFDIFFDDIVQSQDTEQVSDTAEFSFAYSPSEDRAAVIVDQVQRVTFVKTKNYVVPRSIVTPGHSSQISCLRYLAVTSELSLCLTAGEDGDIRVFWSGTSKAQSYGDGSQNRNEECDITQFSDLSFYAQNCAKIEQECQTKTPIKSMEVLISSSESTEKNLKDNRAFDCELLIFVAGAKSRLRCFLWSFEISKKGKYFENFVRTFNYEPESLLNRKKKKDLSKNVNLVSSDVRILSMTVFKKVDTHVLIITGDSIGEIRVFSFDINEHSLSLEQTIKKPGQTSPILTMKSVDENIVVGNTRGQIIILRLLLDENFVFRELVQTGIVDVHQGGINALDIYERSCLETKGTAKFVISAGDDQSVVLSVLKPGKGLEPICTQRNCAFSSIKAMSLTKFIIAAKDVLVLLTAGLDQRVRIWNVSFDLKKKKRDSKNNISDFDNQINNGDCKCVNFPEEKKFLELKNVKFTSISTVNQISAIESENKVNTERRCIIAGSGFEIFSFEYFDK